MYPFHYHAAGSKKTSSRLLPSTICSLFHILWTRVDTHWLPEPIIWFFNSQWRGNTWPPEAAPPGKICCSNYLPKWGSTPSTTHMTFHSNSVLFWWKFIWCWAPTKAHLFCMNQFHKLHHLELRNLILTYFKNILKTKKMQKGMPEGKWQPNFIRKGLWNLNIIKNEKSGRLCKG